MKSRTVKRKMPSEWFHSFMAEFPEGTGWNNVNNWTINHYWSEGLTPEEAAKKFTTHGM